MVVRDLADALDAQRLPGEVLAAVPARGGAWHPLVARPLGPLAPGMRFGGAFAQWQKLRDELLALLGGERGGDAHVMQLPVAVVKPEQERAHHRARPVLVPAEYLHHP